MTIYDNSGGSSQIFIFFTSLDVFGEVFGLLGCILKGIRHFYSDVKPERRLPGVNRDPLLDFLEFSYI